MTSRRHKKEYYAVVSGRIDEPTIFSSWGDAHPRVTGCSSKYKAFPTIEGAQAYMNKNGVTEPKEVIKDGAGNTTPLWSSEAFYAVAHGDRPGITRFCGTEGAELKVKEIPGACYKRFKTLAQAESFIEDWKESFADVWRREIKDGLDQGLRPCGMKFGLGGILCGTEIKIEDADTLAGVGLDRLSLEEE